MEKKQETSQEAAKQAAEVNAQKKQADQSPSTNNAEGGEKAAADGAAPFVRGQRIQWHGKEYTVISKHGGPTRDWNPQYQVKDEQGNPHYPYERDMTPIAEPSEATLLQKLGLDEKKATETTKNKVLTKTLLEILKEVGTNEILEKSVGNHLYTIGTKYEGKPEERPELVRLVASKKIKTAGQLTAALKFLKSRATSTDKLDVSALEASCGAGAEVTDKEIEDEIQKIFNAKKDEIMQQRYRYNSGGLLLEVKEKGNIKWADGAVVKQIFDKQWTTFLGPKTAEDEAPVQKPKAAKPKKEESTTGAPVVNLQDSVRFPAPEENTQLKPEILKKHLEETGGRIVTRFPPEPNGFLHLGHCKAMNVSFGYAKKHNGYTYLRYDDTNPEKEKQVYIDSIHETVKWLGHTPYKITYASDYFPQLYEYAIQLIKGGWAYADNSTKDQIAEQRALKQPSPCRNKSVEDNLRIFEGMKQGKYKEGEWTLRLKQDIHSANPCMWDLIAYRIKYVPHPHVGDKWCIYPSYDYTHCICDSIENITHSLCSLEFEVRREPYNWTLDKLGIYRPPQIEYSRLNVEYVVLSKRKLIQLVDERYVSGWDDPRMPTINGLRRRGYTPEALNTFCEKVGVTRSPQTLEYGFLEQCCRLDLNDRATRAFVVIHPLKVTITNWPQDQVKQIQTPNHPTNSALGTREMPFSRVVYIEKSDFALQDSPDYYGLAPNKRVGLRYAYQIVCTDVVKDKDGNVIELKATYDENPKPESKPKGWIHWVAEPTPGKTPKRAEVRLYDQLFKSPNLNEVGDNWLSDLNSNSLHIERNAFAEPSLANAKPFDKFQFERVGYFCVDPDSTPENPVFNRTVGLKDAYHEKEEKKPAAKPKEKQGKKEEKTAKK